MHTLGRLLFCTISVASLLLASVKEQYMSFIRKMNTKEYAEKLKLMIKYEEVAIF